MLHDSRSVAVYGVAMMAIELIATTGMAETYVYDYSNVTMASPFPGDPLDGQDNWYDGLRGGQSARDDLDHVPGIMGQNAYYAASGAQAGRLNDEDFSYVLSGDTLTLEYVGRIQQFSLTSFALAVDTDGDGFIFGEEGSGEVAFQFGVTSDQWYVRAADFGEELTSEPLGLGGSGHTWRMVLEADLAANGGDGSGSLFVQQLGDVSNNPVDDMLTPVDDLQDVNLRLLDLDGMAADPANWNAIFTVLGAGNLDDLTIITGDGQPRLQAGDADEDLDFDQLDLVKVQIAAKYLTGQSATWGEGDWDGAPGGSAGNPPAGDGIFDQKDIIAALAAGHYLSGPYAAIEPWGTRGDEQASIIYDAGTGEIAVDAPASRELTSINIDSAAGIFTGDPAQNVEGSFDNDSDDNIFKATFGTSFGSLSFGNVAQLGLSRDFVLNDLTVVGSLEGGGGLGPVDLCCIPEPSSIVLVALGVSCLCLWDRRRQRVALPFALCVRRVGEAK